MRSDPVVEFQSRRAAFVGLGSAARIAFRGGSRALVAAALLVRISAQDLRPSPRAEVPPIVFSAASGNVTPAPVHGAASRNRVRRSVPDSVLSSPKFPMELPPAAGVTTVPSLLTVTFQDFQLTIDAQNSTLAEVLREVAERTGTTINVPPGSGMDLIVEHIGPAPFDAVLKHLLEGSDYNFVIIGSPQHPQYAAQVLLSLPTSSPGGLERAPVTQVATTPPGIWTAPQSGPPEVMPARYDSSLIAPSEPVSPEELGELMKRKAQEILEKNQQQYPQQ